MMSSVIETSSYICRHACWENMVRFPTKIIKILRVTEWDKLNKDGVSPETLEFIDILSNTARYAVSVERGQHYVSTPSKSTVDEPKDNPKYCFLLRYQLVRCSVQYKVVRNSTRQRTVGLDIMVPSSLPNKRHA